MRAAAATVAAVMAALLAPASPALALDATSPQVAALAARARHDPSALSQLRSIDRVDGRPVALSAALGGARHAALRARLRALEAAGRPARSGAAAQERRRALAILGQRRYRQSRFPHPLQSVFGLIGRAFDRLVGWLGDRLPGGRPGGWTLLALLVLLAAGVGARRLLGRAARSDQAGSPGLEAAPGGDDPEVLEREAQAAEARGDLERAVRLRFRAGLLRLDRAGAVELRPSLTSRELTRRLGSGDFERLARSFDAVAYGGRRPEPAEVEDSRAGWARVLAEVGAR